MNGWLLGVVGAAMLAAVARCLMPPGAVQQVGNLVCGMVLVWAVLQPLQALVTIPGTVRWSEHTQAADAELRQQGEQLLKSLIEQECETYIVDKATRLGADCSAQVVCKLGEGGVWLPDRIRVTGELTAQQRRELEELISADLGVDGSRQEFTGGG